MLKARGHPSRFGCQRPLRSGRPELPPLPAAPPGPGTGPRGPQASAQAADTHWRPQCPTLRDRMNPGRTGRGGRVRELLVRCDKARLDTQEALVWSTRVRTLGSPGPVTPTSSGSQPAPNQAQSSQSLSSWAPTGAWPPEPGPLARAHYQH